jgi:hypothetical protein
MPSANELRAQAVDVVSAHWREIDAVAQALLDAKRLDGRQIEAIMRRTRHPSALGFCVRTFSALRDNEPLSNYHRATQFGKMRHDGTDRNGCSHCRRNIGTGD